VSERRNANDEPLDLGLLPGLLGYRLRRAQIAAFQHFAATVGKSGITPGWFGLMVIVANNAGLSQTRLARALGVDGSTMVAMIAIPMINEVTTLIPKPNTKGLKIKPSVTGPVPGKKRDAPIAV